VFLAHVPYTDQELAVVQAVLRSQEISVLSIQYYLWREPGDMKFVLGGANKEETLLRAAFLRHRIVRP
jgi:hypothetical protein